MSRTIAPAFLLFSSLLLLPIKILAQGETTSAIVGRVTDGTSAAIPGATVSDVQYEPGQRLYSRNSSKVRCGKQVTGRRNGAPGNTPLFARSSFAQPFQGVLTRPAVGCRHTRTYKCTFTFVINWR